MIATEIIIVFALILGLFAIVCNLSPVVGVIILTMIPIGGTF
ncbi:hypothetical protein [Bacillus sp. NPDC094106]